jgi:hypothetical protein
VIDTNMIKLAQPGTFTDSLTEILRNGARALLTQTVETEVADFLGRYTDLKTEAGRQRVVRHGHLPEREISPSPAAAVTAFAVSDHSRQSRLPNGAGDP